MFEDLASKQTAERTYRTECMYTPPNLASYSLDLVLPLPSQYLNTHCIVT